MTPEDAVLATQAAVHDVPAVFMLHGSTYARGGELGFDGIDFYACGRGGPLGDVDADVVSAAFVFFDPAYVRGGWERGASVMSRAEAGREFLDCGYGWARRKLPTSAGGPMDDAELAELADLAGTIVAKASPAGAPMFAAYRAHPAPDPSADAAAAALHQLNGLRELRAAQHGNAILAAGLTPLEALSVKTPFMAQIFGYDGAVDVGGTDLPDRWRAAEDATNRAAAATFAVLDAGQLDRLVELCAELPTAPG